MKTLLILCTIFLGLSKHPIGVEKLGMEISCDTLILKVEKCTLQIVKTCDTNGVSFGLLSSSMPIPYLVIEDAEELGIREDLVLIEFVTDSTCSLTGIEIAKKGKLQSFTDFSSEVCVELYQSIKDQGATEFFTCQSIKCSKTSNFKMPLRLRIK